MNRGGQPGQYGTKRMGQVEPLYSGSKSMYNQPMYDRYDGTKSAYNGYDGYGGGGGGGPAGANLRRSRSIHAKFGNPGGSGSRRNPYDFLPDEPVAGRSDVMVTGDGASRLLSASGANPKSAASPRYANDDMYGDYGRSKGEKRVNAKLLPLKASGCTPIGAISICMRKGSCHLSAENAFGGCSRWPFADGWGRPDAIRPQLPAGNCSH